MTQQDQSSSRASLLSRLLVIDEWMVAYVKKSQQNLMVANGMMVAWEEAVMQGNGRAEEVLRSSYLEAHMQHLDAQMVALNKAKEAKALRAELDRL